MTDEDGVVPTWTRPNWQQPTNLRTRQHYIAFYATAFDELTVNARADGLPNGDPLADFEMQAFEDRAWVAGWTAGSLAAFLEAEPGVDAAAVRRCDLAMAAWSAKIDGRSLMGLQAGMALCRAFARAGAVAVLDVVTLRWWSPDDLLELAPDRPFALEEHISLTFEATPIHPEVGHLCHTRGMAKFARPDLAYYVPSPAQVADAGQVLTSVAQAMALGLNPQAGDTTRVTGGRIMRFEAHSDDSAGPSPLFFNTWFELVPAGLETIPLLGP